ncbi:MAG TPA: UDP-3-O-acyl-N-acetylglucosamine deacetylase [Thermoanaerobaculaceae bacterium]|nr:UDP-3-O-acyl-N-acetylglucosamine deacetylase [Thermoanaerobaculaceae bacterium]HPS77841.1 UDP-3-O-acyl-N-acetylglucosamine deacetylase [Thermoanaerobaculaceae bacterium]
MKDLVLIVDDEPGILAILGQILGDEGYEVEATASGEEAISVYRKRRPVAVFLDVWLPDRDGLETLKALRELDPKAAVIMMSGHGQAATAVKSIKLGAHDYLEKPLAYERIMEALNGALAARRGRGAPLLDVATGTEPARVFAPPPVWRLVRPGRQPQRTIRSSSVIYGLGLHSGSRTGLVLQPLPPDSGVHFVTLPQGTQIPAHLASVGDTEYATTISRDGEEVRTVEHLLATLHAAGITNLLVKVHGEIPVIDGSAIEFCQRLEEIGIEEQGVPRREVVIDHRYELPLRGDKRMVIEPADTLQIAYRLRYPPPIGEQFFDFRLTAFDAFQAQIAPARTFGFLRDLPMIKELGLGSGGRLDNFILVGEDNVINTALRFPDEFVRHKILDIVGDLYLLGYPVRGRITAAFTGHRDNIALQRLLLAG